MGLARKSHGKIQQYTHCVTLQILPEAVVCHHSSCRVSCLHTDSFFTIPQIPGVWLWEKSDFPIINHGTCREPAGKRHEHPVSKYQPAEKDAHQLQEHNVRRQGSTCWLLLGNETAPANDRLVSRRTSTKQYQYEMRH